MSAQERLLFSPAGIDAKGNSVPTPFPDCDPEFAIIDENTSTLAYQREGARYVFLQEKNESRFFKLVKIIPEGPDLNVQVAVKQKLSKTEISTFLRGIEKHLDEKPNDLLQEQLAVAKTACEAISSSRK